MGRGPTGLVERTAELHHIEAALDDTLQGGSAFVWLEGPGGIGKSSLVEAAHWRASERGFTVLCARGSELERSFAYAAVRQLFEPELIGADPEHRARVLSGAAAHALPALETFDSEAGQGESLFAVLHGLYWLVANLAAENPLLITVDDAHWVDDPSLRFIGYLARRIEGVPVTCLVAARPREGGVEAEQVGRFAENPGGLALRPAPLSREGVAELIGREFSEQEVEPAFGDACHGWTGGNPFLVGELSAALRADGMLPSADSAERVREFGPHTVSRSILLRLAGLSSASDGLARAAALLGDAVELRHAAALAGIESEEAVRAADALTAAQVLVPGSRLSFVHPIVRSAIYQDLQLAERERLHERAARMLLEEGAPSARAAAHLLELAPSGRDWVIAALRGAARDAIGGGAPDVAAGYLRRALEEPPALEERAALLGELGSAERLAEDPGAVGHLTEAIRQTGDPTSRARLALDLGRAVAFSGDIGGSIQLIAEQVEAAEAADPELAMKLDADLASLGLTRGIDIERSLERLGRYARVEGVTAAERLLLAAQSAQGYLQGTAAEASAKLAARSLADGQLLADETSDSLIFHETVWVQVLADELDAADANLDAALADARSRGSGFGFSCTSAMRALVALRRGELAQAEAEAEAAIEGGVLPGFVAPAAYSFLISAHVLQGKVGVAEQALAASGTDDSLEPTLHTNSFFFARGLVRLAGGDVQAAIDDFLETGRRDAALGSRVPATPWRSTAATLLMGLGRDEEARRLVEEELERAREWGAPSIIGASIRARAGFEEGANAVASLEEAVSILAPTPARLDHARALIELGAAMRRGGRRSAAVDPLTAGWELAQRLGAAPMAELATAELTAAGARPRKLMFSGVESLTASERRVVDMAIEGMSNKDIAQALFVTAKTVENHLGRAYMKLGIHSREDLAVALSKKDSATSARAPGG